jgi:hypothetical protein
MSCAEAAKDITDLLSIADSRQIFNINFNRKEST